MQLKKGGKITMFVYIYTHDEQQVERSEYIERDVCYNHLG